MQLKSQMILIGFERKFQRTNGNSDMVQFHSEPFDNFIDGGIRIYFPLAHSH